MRKVLSATPDVVAPDGSDVRLLAASKRGSMAHFTLAPGKVSKAVRHHTVEEIWFILTGSGSMWMKDGESERMFDLTSGLSFTIAAGCSFQFRNDDVEPLRAVAITMPPWPGEQEAQDTIGKWQHSA